MKGYVVPLSVTDVISFRVPSGHPGDVSAEREREFNMAVNDLESDEVVPAVVSTAVQQMCVSLASCNTEFHSKSMALFQRGKHQKRSTSETPRKQFTELVMGVGQSGTLDALLLLMLRLLMLGQLLRRSVRFGGKVWMNESVVASLAAEATRQRNALGTATTYFRCTGLLQVDLAVGTCNAWRAHADVAAFTLDAGTVSEART